MLTPGNQSVGPVSPGDPTGAQKGIIYRSPSSPPCSRTVPWLKHLFSPSNIPQLDRAGSFISEKEIYIYPSINSHCCPLEQHQCQCSQLTPLVWIQQIYPTCPPTHAQPVSNKPVSPSPLSKTRTKQLQNPDHGPTTNCPITTHINPSGGR